MPTIDGWANLADVLDGGELFLTTQLLHRAPPSVQENASGVAILDEPRGVMAPEQQLAIAEGTQYLFNHKTLDVSVSLLWRVAATDKTQMASVQGFSRGGVLCLGKPTSPTAKAVVFQNFELPVYIAKGIIPGNVWHEDPSFDVKGGFILPREIQEATNLHDI